MFTRHPGQGAPVPGIRPRPYPDPSCSPACGRTTWTGSAGGGRTAPLMFLGYMDTLERFRGFSLATLDLKEIDS